MLQLFPRRQISHVEQSTSKIPKLPQRKISECYLERKTRHGSVISIEMSEVPLEGADLRKDQLIKALKREVKRIMDESGIKRRVCLYSNIVSSICVAVENCLLDGLRRRLLGLFGVKTTFALLHCIAKNCGPAANVIKRTTEHGIVEGSRNTYLWIRVALHERALSSIVDHIFNSPQCRRYYEKDALMLDPSRGGMVAAILVAPCAIDYTLLKPMDIGYRDPTADELVQRSRITSTASAPSSSPKRPPLSVMKRGNSMIKSAETNPVATSFNRDYVFSLHQNMRSSLLYGKNNVCVSSSEKNDLLKGYLSLHRENTGLLTVKWTPNQLMHSSSEPSPAPKNDNNKLWKYVVNINMQTIIYLHLHQNGEEHPVSLVFVDAEGVQYAPFQFPPGQHCLSFLACLETGLSPFSRLDPPLWNHEGKGKILPRLKRKTSTVVASLVNMIPKENGITNSGSSNSSSIETSNANGDLQNNNSSIEINDYVFRIINTTCPNGPPLTAPISNSTSKNITDQLSEISFEEIETPESGSASDKPSCHSVPASPYVNIDTSENSVDKLVRHSLGNACESMRLQILSRAFYGWLAYCRHLKTIRTHLSGLVNTKSIYPEAVEGPVNAEFWKKCRKEKSQKLFNEFIKRTYIYGIIPELRVEAWPYIIKLVNWSEELPEYLPVMEERYTQDLQRWGTIEEKVILRDQEAFKAARLRQSSVNGDMSFPPIREQSFASDVFEEEPPQKENGEEIDDVVDIVEEFGSNLHRIEKDVDRCDRNTEYFSKTENLQRLKRIMCTYVWRHISDGYVQGMCDIAAPLLVIFENEVVALECFEKIMERMRVNFPHYHGIEENLGNLRSIVQVMDPELFELMMSNADFTHLYFAYRWFLLDFKRELTYENVFKLWEVIMAAEHSVSPHFQLFFALAMLTQYRHIVIENNMDFTDIIKFYNEMAEKHDVNDLLTIARDKLLCLQTLIKEMN